MSWTAAPMAAFDLETTGPIPTNARIVTAHLALIDGKVTSGRNWLLNPQQGIPEGATAVHGITTEHAREHGQDYATGYDEIRQALTAAWDSGHAVVAFNAAYDLTIIDREGVRLGYAPLEVGLVIDPFVIDRAVDPYRKGKRTLEATCKVYGVRLDDAHSASGDALAAARLAWKMARKFPKLAEIDVMAWQSEANAKRQSEFATYLRREGKDASDVNGDWPMRGRMPAAEPVQATLNEQVVA
ncbi:3'-5' exonuclease [Rhodococcus hoagii]|uniref:3'-5' exonuclease n=1 Tax=Rhodococcus hoagii TaxID=43767 RepID=A0A9Q4ZKC5_RHOHA|nr:3'-5' exonuclease [Prescottella equi]MBM4480805.1 3'-5' exonuclease [Prescottella equi]MBM4487367.1 3'-5' exonuclease [Prescottella equi]MBM4489402.1 3'-5' exonuclease [Prescottella equi]MBM4489417.1 3'-5' exonuclease [Prescottella equi]MBM4516246.1 3'-5' exonuclease [Prescottella equi]